MNGRHSRRVVKVNLDYTMEVRASLGYILPVSIRKETEGEENGYINFLLSHEAMWLRARPCAQFLLSPTLCPRGREATECPRGLSDHFKYV